MSADRGPRLTAFVLGGAGNLGAMQVGMLRALLEAGIVPDLVVGCSVGAINGAAIAAEPTLQGVARLERQWLEVRRDDVWPAGPAGSVLQLLRRRPSVVGNEGLRRLIEGNLPATFEELALPFACVAASLGSGDERWFDQGALADPVLASAALPGLLPPVTVDGEELIDGAAVNVVPVHEAVRRGASRLFVLQIKDLDAEARLPRRPIEVIIQAFAISRNARFRAELASLPSHVEAHLLPVVPWRRMRYDGFSRTEELIEQARSQAAGYLASLTVAPS